MKTDSRYPGIKDTLLPGGGYAACSHFSQYYLHMHHLCGGNVIHGFSQWAEYLVKSRTRNCGGGDGGQVDATDDRARNKASVKSAAKAILLMCKWD